MSKNKIQVEDEIQKLEIKRGVVQDASKVELQIAVEENVEKAYVYNRFLRAHKRLILFFLSLPSHLQLVCSSVE